MTTKHNAKKARAALSDAQFYMARGSDSMQLRATRQRQLMKEARDAAMRKLQAKAVADAAAKAKAKAEANGNASESPTKAETRTDAADRVAGDAPATGTHAKTS